MVAKKHFQRLRSIYTTQETTPVGDRVAMSYGRAELDGTISSVQSGTVVNRMAHHRLLSDVSSLAAATMEKEHFVTAEHFVVDVEDPQYEGAVEASAHVVIVEPPHFVVEAVLRTADGDLIAEATGVFRPTETALPSSEGEDGDVEMPSTLEPATVMSVHSTPFGMLSLN